MENRFIQIQQHLPGRLRLRLPWLRAERRHNQAEVATLADALAAIPGMVDVQIRPYTASVLCLYDPQRLTPAALLGQLSRVTSVETVLDPGAEPPASATDDAGVRTGTATAAQALAQLFKRMDQRLLSATDGKVDLGTLATLMFVTAGGLQVLTERRIPAPPWFTLAWWGSRTFITFEKEAISAPLARPLAASGAP